MDNDAAREGGEYVAWLCNSCLSAYPRPSLQVLCVRMHTHAHHRRTCNSQVLHLPEKRSPTKSRGGPELKTYVHVAMQMGVLQEY
eukprot:1160264-Pelagomonas_calceolata.AAC.13